MVKTSLYSAELSENATLHLFYRDGFWQSFPLKYITLIGRDTAQIKCDISLRSKIVSRRHGEIVRTDADYAYKDLDSTNGTYVNGIKYGKDRKQTVTLKDGDVISFEIPGVEAAEAEKVIGLFTRTAGTFHWQSLPLTEEMEELCIGREVTDGFRLEDDAVSRKHASLFQAQQGWAIIDHGSTNGVFLNGRRLTYPRYLSLFDVVRIADLYFVFLGDRLFYSGGRLLEQPEEKIPAREQPEERRFEGKAPEKEQPEEKIPAREQLEERRSEGEAPVREQPAGEELCIHIIRRSVMQHFKKIVLLHDIRLTIPSGEMVLILGGSGVGKTTFMNAVMGYEKAEGKILYGDTDIYEEYQRMKYEIGFVPQQDLLRSSDTVLATLSNAAEMKMPKDCADETREKRIHTVLEEFGLTREKNTLVSKLSGGQRKRLNIAVEYISDPNLFFLDEPDSGLDDVMGRGLMENLRQIADKGKIVLVITHSPERAKGLFDKVIVLAKSDKDNSGRLAFYGSVEDAFAFFEVSSFREILKKINRKAENGEGLADFFIEKYNVGKEGN